MKRRALLATFAGSALLPLSPGCATSELPDQRRELLSSWGHAFLLAQYSEFEARAAELEARAAELRDAPSSETLEAARSAWWTARAPWKRAEVFAFGPYSEEPQRIGPKIDFWPARPETIEGVLEDDFELDPEAIEDLGAPAKGLPALEYLLYAPDADPVALFGDPRRGEYVRALAQDLVARAREIHDAWAPEHENFLNELVDAGRSSTRFMNLNAALGEIVNRIGYTLENDRLEKLAPALGDTSDGTPQPDRLESTYSGRSLEDLRDNLAGIEHLYRGDAPSGLRGLDAYLRGRGKNLGRSFDELALACRNAFDALPGTLAEAVSAEPAAVREVMSRFAALQRFFQVDVLNALSLSLGFNDNDGD
ncbi:MAG TPA: imelysin family protein [Polyangiaceae bacterium]